MDYHNNMTISPDEPSVAATADFPAHLAEMYRPKPSPAGPHRAGPSPTEARNPRTLDIDALPALDILRLLNAEDEIVPGAVRAVLGTLALVVDEAASRVRQGGRVHYFGAGSSGRIAVLDATELAPTFGMAEGEVVAHLAGGDEAMTCSAEGAEDDAERGRLEAAEATGPLDVVIGLTASGRTPYVAGALSAAGDRGAYTVVVTSNPASPLIALAAAALVPRTGPEAIAGSTRMKATTAMKLILNSFSTALMIQMCGLSILLFPFAFFSENPRTRQFLFDVLYFWAIGGAAQALISPDIGDSGFPYYRYFSFFISHGLIIASAIVMVMAGGVRITVRSLIRAVVVTNLILVPIYGIDMVLKLIPPYDPGNYFVLGFPPPTGSPVDLLSNIFGPSPRYVVGLEAMGIVVFLLLYAPWPIARLSRRGA